MAKSVEIKFGVSPSNPILYVWHGKRLLTARIGAKEAGELLGYTAEDMKFLIHEKHLEPLGRKRGDTVFHKWKFSSQYIIVLMENQDWLHEAERILWKKIADKKTHSKETNRANSFCITNN